MASRFLEERQNQILELIQKEGRISVKELCKYFKTSAVTIRTDLNTLEKLGKVSRIHGGAVLNSPGAILDTPNQSKKENVDIKRRIGRCAAELVQDGEVIFLSSGSTCTEVYPFLADKRQITVITPNLEAAYWLTKSSNVQVFLIGGAVNSEYFSTTGPIHAEEFKNWNISKAFVSAYGISSHAGLTDVRASVIPECRSVLSRVTTMVALVDSSKWGLTSMITTLTLDEIDILITDQYAPQDMIQCMEDHQIRLIKAIEKSKLPN